MKLISFIIPVYRNEETLQALHRQLNEVSIELASKCDFEFIYIDDGSDDSSLKQLLSIQEIDPRVNVISFSKNFGQVAALSCGLKEANGDAAILMAADLQEPTSLISEMVESWEQGNEITIGYRSSREDGVIDKATSKFFYRLIKFSSTQMPSGGFDFAFLDRKAVDALNQIKEKNRFLQGDMLNIGYNVKFIPYKRQKSASKNPSSSFSKRLKYFIDGILNTSYLPIRLMSLLGVATAFAGFVYAGGIVYLKIAHQTPFKGWAPIMILILIIGGLLMLMLGVIGEYLWRIYDEVRNRPNYIIKKKYVAEKEKTI